MRLPETFFTERQRHLLSWGDRPVLGEVGEDGTFRIGDQDAVSGKSGAGVVSMALDGDAILYAESREVFTSVTLDGGPRLAVVETGLDGTQEHWQAALPAAANGPWTIHDVLEGRDESGASVLVLTVQDARGATEFHQVSAGGPVTVHTPRAGGQLVHWDLRYDTAVVRQDQGPREPVLHLERPVTGTTPVSVPGHWRDGWDGRGLIVQDAEDGPRLVAWDLGSSSLRPVTGTRGHVDDARILRDGTGRLLVITTIDGADVLHLWSDETGEAEPLPLAPAGRLRFRVAGPRGIGLYSAGTLAGSAWLWLDEAGALHRSRGDIPAHDGGAGLRHVTYSRTPVLEYLPEEPPVALVISLHGGPESVERDELRWDGLYRDLLKARIAVMGLNYSGSLGYGTDHTRRAWKNWTRAFEEDLRACIATARTWGLDDSDIALLGGSFGGGLALLGCGLQGGLSGAVCSAPLIDIRAHAQRAADADTSYEDWFGERFELGASTSPAQRVFDPVHLSAASPGPRAVLIHGDQDEVTEWRDSRDAVDLAVRHGLDWKLLTEPGLGHVPGDVDEVILRYGHVKSALSEVLGHPLP
ncbi:prolyl oligopeptidase family serine peptidase [Streptomyces sp. NPDC091273]|uniref:prolyl oligopeptidase family serine peptidase n=1 Tax=Streptomyces sp. NPDC091273 TaxID=3365982 RepID=UPI00381D3CC3